MRTPITAELRDYVSAVRTYHITDVHGKKREYVDTTTMDLLQIADRIDREHRRRMDDCRLNTRREVVRYMRGVLNDYDHDIKRVRKGDAVEVVRCGDCRWARTDADRLVCHLRPLMAHYVEGEDYCSRGERREDEEPPMSEGAQRVFDRLMRASGGDEVTT